MLISNSLACIFVHIHKCAGTSIELAFDKHLAWNDILLGSSKTGMSIQDAYSSRFGLSKHSSAADIRRVVGVQVWNDYFTFAFVRHPCDRMVSLYEYGKTVREDWVRVLPENSLLKRVPFRRQRNASKLTLDDVPDTEPWNWSLMKALLTTSTFSEFIRSDYLCDEAGAKPQVLSIDDPVSGQRLVDFVGKTESIQRDWSYVCGQLGMTVPDLGRFNESATRKSSNWRDWYSSADLDFVRERYDADFRSLDYRI